MEDRVTAFLVERNFGGVTHGKPEDKLGIRGSNTCQVIRLPNLLTKTNFLNSPNMAGIFWKCANPERKCLRRGWKWFQNCVEYFKFWKIQYGEFGSRLFCFYIISIREWILYSFFFIQGMLRKLMGWTAEHAVTRKQFGKPLMDFDLIKEKFANMAVKIYAMESMAYLTSGERIQTNWIFYMNLKIIFTFFLLGMLDTYAEPDCAMEAAMVKVIGEGKQ